MRLLHVLARTHASFDDPDLVSRAGLVPVMALAQKAGLPNLVRSHVRVAGPCGVNPDLKVPCLVAGMAVGADSIDDMGAPAAARRDARPFRRHPGAVHAGLASALIFLGECPPAGDGEPGAARGAGPAGAAAAWQGDAGLHRYRRDAKRVYGHRKQGAAFGHTKIQGKSLLVRGLSALAATICTPLAAPVIACTRLRGGNANSARGAASFAAEAIGAARAAGCGGLLIVRADPAYYSAAFCGAVRRGGARLSVTVNTDPKIAAAIAAIEDAWTAIKYPRAIWDDQLRCWVSDAQGARSTSPPAPPGTAAGTSRCTCPKAGTANTNG